MDARSSKIFKEDCKGRTNSPVTMILDLPMVVMIEILSRLTIKFIFRCKMVYKIWYLLLTSDPLFVKMYHQKRSTNFPRTLLSINGSVRLLVELKDDDSHPLNRAIVLSPRFHLPSPTFSDQNMILIGSYNGFICLLYDWMMNTIDHSVYLRNPLLGEYLKVKLPKWEKRIHPVAYAFCFNEASKQYKVLRSVVRKFEGRPQVSALEVYTLGVAEKWKNVGEAPETLCVSFSKANINGIVHWMGCKKTNNIYSFSSWTEEVKSLLAPRGLESSFDCLTLVELGNYLCLCNNGHSQYVDIWWMKEYGVAEFWSINRILKESIQRDIRYDAFIPFSIWKDGEILMQRDRGTQVVSYNPKEEKFTKVKEYGGYAATSYIPSVYSLKTVIGKKFQVSYAYPKIEIV